MKLTEFAAMKFGRSSAYWILSALNDEKSSWRYTRYACSAKKRPFIIWVRVSNFAHCLCPSVSQHRFNDKNVHVPFNNILGFSSFNWVYLVPFEVHVVLLENQPLDQPVHGTVLVFAFVN